MIFATPDFDLVKRLRGEDAGKLSFVPAYLETGGKAQDAIAKSADHLLAVFVDSSIQGPPAISVLRKCRQVAASVPVYVLLDDGAGPFSDADAKSLRIVSQLKKPVTLMELQDLLLPRTPGFDPAEAIKAARLRAHTLDQEISEEDKSFAPILARNFISGKTSFFDLYVRLGENRYVKILQAGDDFERDRVTRYLEKGLKHFYIKAESQEHYLAYVGHIGRKALEAEKLPTAAMAERVIIQGNETVTFLERSGIEGRKVLFAKGFVNNAFDLVEKIAKDTAFDLDKFLSDLVSVEHGVAVALVAALLGRELKLTNEGSKESLGLAALLHDVGLHQLPQKIWHADESKMSPEEQALYRMHPELGAKLLATIKGIQPGAVQAVAQHHERRDRRGFPGRIAGSRVNGLAEVIGISDEAVHLMERIREQPRISFVDTLENDVFNGFSFAIVEAFRNVFFLKTKKTATAHGKKATIVPEGKSESPGVQPKAKVRANA